MSDPRIRSDAVKTMTNGTDAVKIEMEFTFTPDGEVRITDRAHGNVGDACAALHQAALEEIGLQITEARNTDAYERKPDDPAGVLNGARSTHTNRT